MSRPLCLASCFLPLDEENCRWWLRIQEELGTRGLDLVLLSSAPASDKRLRVILVPVWLHGFGQAYGAPQEAVTLEAPLADALVRRDRSWVGQEDNDIAEFHTGLATCQHVFRTLLNELQPALVLVWGNSLGQSVVLQQLAVQQGRPCWVIERGLFPDTLMIELAGQGGQTELNWSFNLQSAWRTAPDAGLFQAVKSLFWSRRATKYAQAEFLSPEIFHQRHNPKGRKLIALLLQQDASSCLVPDDYLGARIHAPVFKSSAGAIVRLSAAAHELNCQVIVKPHPMDQGNYSKYCDERVCVTQDVNLHSLIGAADVVAAMTSTSQFEALLHEKPLLLLARSALAGKGIAYEPKSVDGLTASLKAALQREDFSARMVNARRFVSFVLQNFSVSLSNEIPAGATIRDLATFLSQNAVAFPPARTLGERLSAVGNQLALWESAAKEAALTSHRAGPESATNINYQSHIGQDAWVAECLEFKRNGFFLDFGAFDGKTISNTYALEKDLGWRGICVEPNPRYYPQVCECRNCISVNVALWHESRQQLRFVDAHGLSAIESFKETDVNANRRQNATKGVIEVDTMNPNELLRKFNAPALIDYLTLDVEGAEFDILKALDLNAYSIALMTIEHNHDTERQALIRTFLAQFGYEVVQNRNDDFFFHRGHLARLLDGKVIDPVAVFRRVYDTFQIAEPGGKKSATPPVRRVEPDFKAEPTETLRVSAHEFFKQCSWQEAAKRYQVLASRLGDDLEVWQRHLQCQLNQGFQVMADLILEEALEKHPEWADVLNGKAAVEETEELLVVEGRSL